MKFLLLLLGLGSLAGADPCTVCVEMGVMSGMCDMLAAGSITLEAFIATAPADAGCDTCDHSLFYDACPGVQPPAVAYFDSQGQVVVQELGLPVTSGLHAHYTAGTFAGSTWYDMSGNGKHSSEAVGTFVSETETPGAAGNDGYYPYIKGDTSTSLVFTTLPSQFTICSTSRWTSGSNQQRILGSSTTNMIHGHHARGRGLAYYQVWKTTQVTKGNSRTDWLVFCGDNKGSDSVVLVDGQNVATANGGYAGTFGVNVFENENSDWGVGDVIIYDGHLSLAQMLDVSNYLQARLDTVSSTSSPTADPTAAPTSAPTDPTSAPTADPTAAPTASHVAAATALSAFASDGDFVGIHGDDVYHCSEVKQSCRVNSAGTRSNFNIVSEIPYQAEASKVPFDSFAAVTSDGTWSSSDGFLTFVHKSDQTLFKFPSTCQCVAEPQSLTFEFCANERSQCTCTGTARFGAGDSWIEKEVNGLFNCERSFFGSDPAVGQIKACECAAN